MDSILGIFRLYILKMYPRRLEKQFEGERERGAARGGTERLNLSATLSIRRT